MEMYLVGGAVRDSIMGLIAQDRDFVVVGSSDEEMIEKGYTKVGRSFSVFLDSEGQEYALARREKKIPGNNPHLSFECETSNVTLREDLYRRDLTINAMVQDLRDTDLIIDFFGGIQDIEDKVFRHISPAFSEDPLRVLRVARFAAKFPDFTVAPETMHFMRKVVQTEEFKSLSKERILGELRKAFCYPQPSRFFEVLREAGGLGFWFPEIAALEGVPQTPQYHPEGDAYVHTMLVLDSAYKISENHTYREEIMYSALVHDLGKGVTSLDLLPKHPGHEEAGLPLVEALSKRLGVPLSWSDAALCVTRNHLRVHRIEQATANSIVRMFYEMDAFRRSWLVPVLARTCEADEHGKNRVDVPQGEILEKCFEVVKDFGFSDIRKDLKGQAIYNEIRAGRVLKLKRFIDEVKND